MYEQILNYFEENVCLENMYFRKNSQIWIIGMVSMLIIEFLVNYLIYKTINNLLIRFVFMFIISLTITGCFLIFYFFQLKKVYKRKIKDKVNIDLIGLFMNEENLGAYREMEIQEMNEFLKKECKIKKIDTIDMIINEITEEIKNKYEKKNFIEKYFNPIILPLIIVILTVYFTNNDFKQFLDILLNTVISVVTAIIIGYFAVEAKSILISPVNKKENLLELRRILIDIKIKWNEEIENNQNNSKEGSH